MRVCFFRHYAYPLFDREAPGRIGGAEVRAYTFATGLSELPEFHVSFIVDSVYRRASIQHGLISVHFQARRKHRTTSEIARNPRNWWQLPLATGHRTYESFNKRRNRMNWSSADVVTRVQADIYCCFGASVETANLMRAVHHQGGQTIMFSICDQEFDDEFASQISSGRSKTRLIEARDFAFQAADQIVVQNEEQYGKVFDQFGRTPVLIRNPVNLQPQLGIHQLPDSVPDRFVLWVGRADTSLKRADRCIEIARRCPEVDFVVLMNRVDEACFDQLVSDLPQNVTVIEHIPFHLVEQLYQRATLLLNTSDFEGFPNAFLQAAKYGVPVVSFLVDPNEMCSRFGCGIAEEGDLEKTTSDLQRLWDGDPSLRQMSQSAFEYATQFHDSNERVQELGQLVRQLGRNQMLRKTA